MNLPQRFPYRAKWTTVVWSAIFFGLGTAVIAHESAHRVGSGAVLLWMLTLLSAPYTVVGLVLVFRRISLPCATLEIGPDGIVLPYGFLHPKRKRIIYMDIRVIHEERVRGWIFLVLHATTDFGRIAASLLPDEDAYTVVTSIVFGRPNLIQE